MIYKNIEFKADSLIIQSHTDLNILPQPIKLNIPKWFKSLNHSADDKTIKGCIPFLETLQSGYLIRNYQDTRIKHNVLNEWKGTDGKKIHGKGEVKYSISEPELGRKLNYPEGPQLHKPGQLGESPLVEKNKNLEFHKILNPWIIVTPPGYSCLFTAPLNNRDDRFEIISGIVATDTYYNHINFPFTLNGDKYEHIDTIIKVGTPVAQVIPFKRESWSHSIGLVDIKKKYSVINTIQASFLHAYKRFFWRKAKWK